MSDQSSARLGLPYLAAGQLQKHVTLNESLTRLDALVQTAVQSRSLSSPPAEAVDGALFILGGAGEGAWSGRPAGALMRRDMGGWVEVAPVAGQIVFVLDAQEIVIRGEDGWTAFSGSGGGDGSFLTIERLGIGAEADEANPFSARLNKALWAARSGDDGGDGDLRFTFNKSGADDVLSLLFQSGFSGRAEIGLVGDDDLRVKVSADGAAWRDVFSVDRATGRAMFARGSARMETHLITVSGAFTVPVWARWVEATAIGGGGGGGNGHSGAPGAARFGGGGGGAGAVSRLRLPVSEVADTPLNIVVGAGGQAGASGGASSLSLSGVVLVSAPGGSGGSAGSSSSGIGGASGHGGAGGGASAVTATAGPGGDGAEPDGPAGGGGGGGLDSANIARAGGAGGTGARLGLAAAGGAAPSGQAGAAGQAAPRPVLSAAGGGGGGGSAANSGAGRPGGAGALHGAGGGGGGAGMSAGGTGGAGAGGVVRLTVIG